MWRGAQAEMVQSSRFAGEKKVRVKFRNEKNIIRTGA